MAESFQAVARMWLDPQWLEILLPVLLSQEWEIAGQLAATDCQKRGVVFVKRLGGNFRIKTAPSFSDSVSQATVQCWNVGGALRLLPGCLKLLCGYLAAGEVGVLPGCFLGLLLAVVGDLISSVGCPLEGTSIYILPKMRKFTGEKSRKGLGSRE